ncbi:Helix-turn-helix domain-containing protein [Fodinibius roseus]|uniref:Helix-turn-helix domain-containing protein n=1 Tax=Fodinibius roseus TaxID=1194090 RepID=A0A1M4XHR2_9BACT|nr:helix-turn-helix transcriptional regulator [Fodinibius roseus]SHE93217.1 Helix-turn-helix domain-containing protein [Fodinibius roseus]
MPSLGNDLAIIRKSRKITLEEIHDSSKIPKTVLASIEDNSIFEDITSNPTYIRSYVRSYAKAVSIDERDIIYALNKVEKNSYSGSLIDDDRRQKIKDKKISDSEGKEKRNRGEPAPTSISENPLSKTREIDSVDWADMGHQFKSTRTPSAKWRITLTVLILLAIGAFLIYWFYVRTPGNNATNIPQQEPPSRTTTTDDSLQLDVRSLTIEDSAQRTRGGGRSSQFREAGEGLPDTLSIVLYAAYGTLEPVRVYTDILDEVNPYWIENGEAIRFNFVNDFQFRDGLDNIILLMNGHVIPDFRERFFNPETGRIEITRSFFQDDPRWLQPPPDTLDIDVPPPSIIHQL